MISDINGKTYKSFKEFYKAIHEQNQRIISKMNEIFSLKTDIMIEEVLATFDKSIKSFEDGLDIKIKELKWQKECIYQSFNFKNEIKDLFYAGDIFLSFSKDTGIDEAFEMAFEMKDDKNAFMPKLVQKFKELLGEGNYYYDFYEFSHEGFSLFFGIHKSVYKEKMKVIKSWLKYEEIDRLVDFEIKE